MTATGERSPPGRRVRARRIAWLGFSVPAHLDTAGGRYVIDCPFPMRFDEEAKRWDIDGGAITWDEVLARWRRRGPANEEFVGLIQRGRRQLPAQGG